MLAGYRYMPVSSNSECQTTDLQRDPCCLAVWMNGTCSKTTRAAAGSDRSGDCLVLWKLDRLERSLPHLLEIVTGLEDRQEGFRCLAEHVDITTPQRTFLFGVIGALVQYERASDRERIIAGLEAARRLTKLGG